MQNQIFFLGSFSNKKFHLFQTPLGYMIGYTVNKKTGSLYIETFQTFEDAFNFFLSIREVRTHKNDMKKVILAKDLYLKGFSTDWTECMTEAYITLNDVEANIIIAQKKDGSITTRIVSSFSEFNIVKGTGNKIKQGLRLFTDLAKLIAYEGKKSFTFSAYQDKIISFA